MSQALYLGALISCLAFGAAAAFHPSARPLFWPARLGLAFGAGAVGLTMWATGLSLARIPWSIAGLGAPLVVLSLGLTLWWRRRPAAPVRPFRPSLKVAVPALVLTVVALLYLGVSLGTGRATSTDYVFFWGVKGIRFALARGIDTEFLKWPYAVHTHTNYPPLVPVTSAWGALWAGRLPWRFGLLSSFGWTLATVPVLLGLLRQRLTDDRALVVTGLWTAAMCANQVSSYSGGNAEAPLIFFLTVAGAALLVERRSPPASQGLDPAGGSPFVPALALAGAVLTKNEGAVAVGLLLVGVGLREVAWRHRDWPRTLARLAWGPAAAGLLWPLLEIVHRLPLVDGVREAAFQIHFRYWREILAGLVRHLEAGTGWLSWALPLIFLAAALMQRRSLVPVLPGLTLTSGILVFCCFYYFHFQEDPTVLIEWTLPRLSQPALSLLVLSAGLTFFSSRTSEEHREPHAIRSHPGH